MRILFTFAALLPLTASAAGNQAALGELPAVTNPDPDPAPLDTIVVTADREARSASETPASISRIDGRVIENLSAKHSDEILNRSAGVYFQHGSGQESLGAIRSPVLSGPGACGVFLMA